MMIIIMLCCDQVLLFANLLHVLAPFRFFGGLAVTVHKMLGGDVPRFMVRPSRRCCGRACRFRLLGRAPGVCLRRCV